MTCKTNIDEKALVENGSAWSYGDPNDIDRPCLATFFPKDSCLFDKIYQGNLILIYFPIIASREKW